MLERKNQSDDPLSFDSIKVGMVKRYEYQQQIHEKEENKEYRDWQIVANTIGPALSLLGMGWLTKDQVEELIGDFNQIAHSNYSFNDLTLKIFLDKNQT